MQKPLQIQRLTQSNCLRLTYDDRIVELTAEFLRVHSPSAEVRQHGRPILVEGKAEVVLSAIEAVGSYGIKLIFNDGHDTGIYTWPYLNELALAKEKLWDEYLEKLHAQHKSRFPQRQVVQIQAPKHSS